MKNFMNYIVLIIFLISCNEQKKEKFIPLEKLSKYYKLYPEFYDERPKYTIEKNIKLIDENFFSRIITVDSNNFIFTRTVSYDPYAMNTLQANQFVLDNILMFKFYKYVRYTSKQHSPIFDYIEYAVEYDTRKKRIIFAFGDYKRDYYSSAYIDWSTKDYLDYGQYKIKMVLGGVPRYMWEINKTTDTITTNLSLKSIKQLYPEFEGVYIFKKYKELVIDFNYSTFDSTFYQNIKFIE